jgi:hypothetical protein
MVVAIRFIASSPLTVRVLCPFRLGLNNLLAWSIAARHRASELFQLNIRESFRPAIGSKAAATEALKLRQVIGLRLRQPAHHAGVAHQLRDVCQGTVGCRLSNLRITSSALIRTRSVADSRSSLASCLRVTVRALCSRGGQNERRLPNIAAERAIPDGISARRRLSAFKTGRRGARLSAIEGMKLSAPERSGTTASTAAMARLAALFRTLRGPAATAL